MILDQSSSYNMTKHFVVSRYFQLSHFWCSDLLPCTVPLTADHSGECSHVSLSGFPTQPPVPNHELSFTVSPPPDFIRIFVICNYLFLIFLKFIWYIISEDYLVAVMILDIKVQKWEKVGLREQCANILVLVFLYILKSYWEPQRIYQ